MKNARLIDRFDACLKRLISNRHRGHFPARIVAQFVRTGHELARVMVRVPP